MPRAGAWVAVGRIWTGPSRGRGGHGERCFPPRRAWGSRGCSRPAEEGRGRCRGTPWPARLKTAEAPGPGERSGADLARSGETKAGKGKDQRDRTPRAGALRVLKNKTK
ncbi:hypothetical protein NDU88_001098 [Pleurodeles waltl]|uniref:Uncharacterized protein n=1 Tax=Pleurodeles waltl TaxID=8319 RepID=A0AAV7U758_PLEWA|nr:hypothetical protein NDU88_001098 [Pleurodeles waltl]